MRDSPSEAQNKQFRPWIKVLLGRKFQKRLNEGRGLIE